MGRWSAVAVAVAVVAVFSSAFAAGKRKDFGGGGNGTVFRDRKGRILSIFQVVTFPNAACVGGSKNGTCFTATECSARGGTNDGSCASGYGVCCTFTLGCGGMSSQNCTYFDSSAAVAGACSVQICPCGPNICQLRLDFSTFVITGPQTASISAVKTENGAVTNQAAATFAQSLKYQCLTDRFSVTSGSVTPPVICGTNSGEHMYVEADPNCNTLAFQLGTGGALNQPATATRTWSIKVNQYSCDFPNLAPSGCTQFFSGSTTGTIMSYNNQGGTGTQLANQNQAICIRRENGSCRICYSTINSIDFDVSGATGTATGLNSAGCCQYKSTNEGLKGYDCIQIPGAQNMATNPAIPVVSRFCGPMGLKTTGATANNQGTVCTLQTPFVVTFITDAYEGAQATGEAINANTGVMLQYVQDAIGCNPGNG